MQGIAKNALILLLLWGHYLWATLYSLCTYRHLARRQQHYKARQQDRQSQNRPQSAYSFKSVASSPNLTALNGPPFGGSFLRLEQDWRETHMAYLQHRNAANSAAQNTLTIGKRNFQFQISPLDGAIKEQKNHLPCIGQADDDD